MAASTTQQLGGGTALALEPGRPGPTRFVATVDAPRPISEAVLELASMDVLEEPTAYPLRPLAGGHGRYIVDGTLLEPNSLWAATLVARDESGAEMGRTRFEFGMGQTGISAGRATPPLDPGLVVAILLVVGGLLLATFAVAGGGLPRTDIRTSRYASVAGSVAAISLGVVILVAGTL